MDVGVLKTEFGRAKVKKGYYTITSKKEGNYNKLLHRLIFEDFYKIKLPSHIIIHHEDRNKLNNEIWNLVPMTNSEHLKIHSRNEDNGMYGRKHRKNTLKLMSISQNNSTGFFRVNKITRNVNQGFVWAYMYYKKGEKHQTFISSVNLMKVKEKVIAKGLDWFVIDEDIAKSVCKEYGYDEGVLLMSTEKRFTLAYEKGNWWAVKDGDITLWKEEVVGLLNELNDKCEFLEIENEALEDGATKYAELYHKSLKENEQLKNEKESWKKSWIEEMEDQEEQSKCILKLVKENEKLKSTVKEVLGLLSDEVDLFSDKATEHDINAYVELKELDNKDAFYMATATKKAIKMLKELQE